MTAARWISAAILVCCLVPAARADELPTVPVPKAAAARPWYALDRSVRIAAAVEATAALYDGATTQLSFANCIHCQEGNPVSHPLLGNRPGPIRMTAAGALEILVVAELTQHLRHSKHKPLRAVSYVLQPAIATAHGVAGTQNFFVSTR